MTAIETTLLSSHIAIIGQSTVLDRALAHIYQQPSTGLGNESIKPIQTKGLISIKNEKPKTPSNHINKRQPDSEFFLFITP